MKTYYIELDNNSRQQIVASGLTFDEAIRFVFNNNGSCSLEFIKYQGGYIRIWEKEEKDYVYEGKIESPKTFVYEVIKNDDNYHAKLFTSFEKAIDFIIPQKEAEKCQIKGHGHDGMKYEDIMKSILEDEYDEIEIVKSNPFGNNTFFSSLPVEPERYYIRRRILC